MRHATLETGGRDSAKRGEGGWASWTAQALFAWTRTHDEPGKSGTFDYIAPGLLCADVLFTYRALARFWAVGAKASHGNNRLLDACFRVFARCAKKKIFNSFTSFSRWKWFISQIYNSIGEFTIPLEVCILMRGVQWALVCHLFVVRVPEWSVLCSQALCVVSSEASAKFGRPSRNHFSLYSRQQAILV